MAKIEIRKSDIRKIVRATLREAVIDAGHDDAVELNRSEEPSSNAVAMNQDDEDKAMKDAREDDLEATEEKEEVRTRTSGEVTPHPVSSVHESSRKKLRRRVQ